MKNKILKIITIICIIVLGLLAVIGAKAIEIWMTRGYI